MVIDFHTHIFADSLAPRALESLKEGCHGLYTPVHNLTKDGLLERMDEWGIDKSVIQPVMTKRTQVEKVSEWAAGLASDRLIPFGGIYPGTDDWREQIDFVASLGLRGIKLHCEYQNFTVDDVRMLRIYDYAFSRDLIILQHAGFDPAFHAPYKSSPKQFAHIAEELKGGIMVAAHFGGQQQWEDVEKYLAGSDIYLDTSCGFNYYGGERFMRILEKHGADRILFATDSPWSNAAEELESLASLPLSEADREKILYKNALKILETPI